MNRFWVGTGWKMNKTWADAMQYCEQLKQLLPDLRASSIQPFVLPPFTALREVSQFMQNNQINCLTGAQNMHFAESGPYTGEISPTMVADTGATLVEMGHSERREFFGETDETVNKKVHAALKHQLMPLICVGDSLQDKQCHRSAEIVVGQVKAALYQVDPIQLKQVLIAYEPIWAIGDNGIPATADEAATVHYAIRQALNEMYGQELGESLPLLYGGSVNQENSVELLSQSDIDGLFIGRAAWDADSYCRILAILADHFAA